MSERNYYEIDVTIEYISAGAVLCVDGTGKKGFIPKMCIQDWDDSEFSVDDEISFSVEEEFLIREGWV